MKKLIAIMTALLTLFLFGCSAADGEETVSDIASTTLPPEATTVESLELEELEPARVLTVYFSHNDGMEAAATYIAEKTEGDIYKIETIAEYPEDEAELVKKAAEDHRENARPAIKNPPGSLSGYDIIFLCFPSWNNTMPMVLFTFIEDYDMRDKIVIPIVGGDERALTNATVDINTLVPGMLVAKGYTLKSDIISEKAQFDQWLDEILYG